LDFARNVVVKAEDRLEARDKNINKKIISSNPKLIDSKVGEIQTKKFENEVFEARIEINILEKQV
jgi:peroxiredoxin